MVTVLGFVLAKGEVQVALVAQRLQIKQIQKAAMVAAGRTQVKLA
jgi:hypothetical protein